METEKHQDHYRGGSYISMHFLISVLEQGYGSPNYTCPVNKMKSNWSFDAMGSLLSHLNPKVMCQALQFDIKQAVTPTDTDRIFFPCIAIHIWNLCM